MDEYKPNFFECSSCDYTGDYSSLCNHLIRVDHMNDEQIKELLIEYLEDFSESHECVTEEIINEKACLSVAAYRNRFGTWNNALEKATGEVNKEQNIPKEKLLSEIERVSEIINDSPSQSDMGEHSKYSVGPFKRKFGSFNNAKEILSMKKYQRGDVHGERNGMYGESEKSTFYNVTGEEHPAYEHGEGSNNNYGPRWRTITKELKEAEGYECKVCGLDENKHIKLFGKSLDTHHIKPQKQFEKENGEIDFEEANKQSNLVSLCKVCHGKIEGKISNCSKDEFIQSAKEMI